ncbi:MAG: response regulator [Eubacterium sp.]|nr:response regulator [Eubacterium sp.]
MEEKCKTIVTSENESFLVRVLVKKLQDAGIDAFFVPWSVNQLGKRIGEVELVTVYMDDGERPTDKTAHFLTDHMMDEGKLLILVGEKNDLQQVHKQIPPEVIYRSFERPIDNAEYVETIKDFFQKVEEGTFRKSILVVDDDPNYLTLVRDWLKDKYKVTMANSGLQAIKYLGKNKVDLILLDHEMPVTSGPQVLEMLRSDDETKDIPVVFLTGKSDKESVMAVVALKPEGYFLKTIERADLVHNLETFFAKHMTHPSE